MTSKLSEYTVVDGKGTVRMVGSQRSPDCSKCIFGDLRDHVDDACILASSFNFQEPGDPKAPTQYLCFNAPYLALVHKLMPDEELDPRTLVKEFSDHEDS